MSMTREEAINRIKDHMAAHHIGEYPHIKLKEALDMALSFLRPVSREQVEKVWRGNWNNINPAVFRPNTYYTCRCSMCGTPQTRKNNFCSHCGAPMTDEAVDILLRRLEALHEADLI